MDYIKSATTTTARCFESFGAILSKMPLTFLHTSAIIIQRPNGKRVFFHSAQKVHLSLLEPSRKIAYTNLHKNRGFFASGNYLGHAILYLPLSFLSCYNFSTYVNASFSNQTNLPSRLIFANKTNASRGKSNNKRPGSNHNLRLPLI